MFTQNQHSIFDISARQPGLADEELRRLRRTLHNSLIDKLDSQSAVNLNDITALRQELQQLLLSVPELKRENLALAEQQVVIQQVVEELQGLGPVSALMLDPAVTDILINGPFSIWVERHGQLQQTALAFDNDAHLRRFLERIVNAQGKQLDASNPMVDARLADGSRLHAVIPPLCGLGAVVSIRRFHNEQLTADRLVQAGFISSDMLAFLKVVVNAGINIVIAGSAGSGKTSLLNVISGYIPSTERIITVEETSELQLHHPHVIPLESRGMNSEGRGGVSLRDLVKTALRMRANRIIVGEVRGGEVFDMLQAMNCGHDGSLTTIHANSPQDVIHRLQALAQMEEATISRDTIAQMIKSCVQVIVQVRRFHDGSRRVVSICELTADSVNAEMSELFRFDQHTSSHQVTGQHITCTNHCYLTKLIAAKGFSVGELQLIFDRSGPTC